MRVLHPDTVTAVSALSAAVIPTARAAVEFAHLQHLFFATPHRCRVDLHRLALHSNLPCAADDESSAGFSATMFLSNVSPAPVAFKVKTTKPERYLVRPNQGVLAAGAVHVDVKGACSC